MSDFFIQHRVFPRLFGAFYLFITYQVVQWFMGIEVPNESQAAFASMIGASSAAYFKFYVDTSGK